MITLSPKQQLQMFDWKEKEPAKNDYIKTECLHKQCPNCNGTGIRKDGLGSCVHMISCPCPKCTPRC